MKKIIAILTMVFAFVMFAKADNEKPITVKELPAAAQTFLNNHFSGKKIALAKKETEFFGTTYDVIFTNGDKIEFDRNGNWKEVKCKYSLVPEAVVPAQILKYVKENYPGANVLEIEKGDRDYEVKLSNRVDLEFDTAFRLLDVDIDY